MNPILLDFLVALAGWLAWNAIMLSIYKDANEQAFNLRAYVSEHWDNWLASLVMIPVLLFFGSKGLGIKIDEYNINWDDSYYVASGFITEAVKMLWKKWKSKNS